MRNSLSSNGTPFVRHLQERDDVSSALFRSHPSPARNRTLSFVVIYTCPKSKLARQYAIVRRFCDSQISSAWISGPRSRRQTATGIRTEAGLGASQERLQHGAK